MKTMWKGIKRLALGGGMLIGGSAIANRSAEAQIYDPTLYMYGIESRQRAIQADLYMIGTAIERAERERREDRAWAAEKEFRDQISRTPNTVYVSSNGDVLARGPIVETTSASTVPTPAPAPDRLHKVQGWSFTYSGVKLPLYDLNVPAADVADPDSYRGYINGSRVIAQLEGSGYSDIYWFPFKEEFKAAQKCDGVLLGNKDGKRHVLVGVRVVAE